MPRSKKSSRKCSRRDQIYIKTYKRTDGTKVKGHCSRPKGRKSRSSSPARRSYKNSKKLVCSPPKSLLVKSFRRSNGKRVKAHCSLPRGGRFGRVSPGFVQQLKQDIKQEVRDIEQKYEEEPVRASPCQDKNKFECVEELDENGLRRCRYNFKLNSCEDLPVEFRKRATMQVGGSAEYVPYVAGERQRLTGERLAPFRQDEQDRKWRRVEDGMYRRMQAQGM